MPILNAHQTTVTKVHADGDFAYVTQHPSDENHGDGLFSFLMTELSDAEDCDSNTEACRRVAAAIEELQTILHALETEGN